MRGQAALVVASEAVLLAEALNASLGVHQFLGTGVEGVALTADIDFEGRRGGQGLEAFAADAAHLAGHVFWMNVGFHDDS